MSSKRKYSSKADGSSFDLQTKNAVWRRGRIVEGKDSNKMRKDACGAWIKYSDYGDTDSQFGWEIDHIKPVSRGGTDKLENLQPLQWANNRHKSDTWPDWTCKTTAIKG